MTDEAPAEPQGTPAPEPQTDATDWKAEARKWEARSKENAGAAQKLAELEEASKSELQKAIDRAAAAESALSASQAESLRLSIAARHGISGDNLDLLSGADEAELEAKATKLSALIAEQKSDPFPKADPSQGPKDKAGPTSNAQTFARQLEEAGL